MSSAPCYVLMTEEDFNEALTHGETCKDLALNEYMVMEEGDFQMYSDYIKSVEYHEDEASRIEVANKIHIYLGDIIQVKEHGVIEISIDSQHRFAAKKLDRIKSLVEKMTPEEFTDSGEFTLRETVRNTNIFAYPIDYYDNDNMPVGNYLHTMDAFIYDLPKLTKPLRLVVIQTMWLHQ